MLSHAGIGLCAGAGIVLAAKLLLHVHAGSESSDTHDQDNAWGQGLAPSPWTASTIPPCSDVMLRYQAVPAVASTPPRSMPADTVRGFTADGAIPTAEFFVDDTIGGKGSHYQYPLKDVEYMLSSAKQYIGGTKSTARLPPMDRWIVEALRRHPLTGMTVAIYGSMSPWYEAMAVAAGASKVVTVEYNNLTYTHPKMEQVTPREFAPPPGGFDAAISISSFDHDGLGRYGDPVHPDGDLLAMAVVRCALRPGGIFLLTVPVGPDIVVWNLHRRYGPVRLPLLLQGWDVVDVAGWSWTRFNARADYRHSYEPVLVLRAPIGTHADADPGTVAAEERVEL